MTGMYVQCSRIEVQTSSCHCWRNWERGRMSILNCVWHPDWVHTCVLGHLLCSMYKMKFILEVWDRDDELLINYNWDDLLILVFKDTKAEREKKLLIGTVPIGIQVLILLSEAIWADIFAIGDYALFHCIKFVLDKAGVLKAMFFVATITTNLWEIVSYSHTTKFGHGVPSQVSQHLSLHPRILWQHNCSDSKLAEVTKRT